MENSIVKYVIQADNPKIEQDTSMLNDVLFDVNMRLFRNNKRYNKVIMSIIKYMTFVLNSSFDDYAVLKGISGANVGIPYNIVVVKMDSRRTKVFINPVMTDHSAETIKVKSNCGSLRLKEKVMVERYKKAWVMYFDKKGHKRSGWFEGPEALTIQHEIDHNMGILITDKKI